MIIDSKVNKAAVLLSDWIVLALTLELLQPFSEQFLPYFRQMVSAYAATPGKTPKLF